MTMEALPISCTSVGRRCSRCGGDLYLPPRSPHHAFDNSFYTMMNNFTEFRRFEAGDLAARRSLSFSGKHRQALESSIAENQHMRAEHRRQAAVVAEARCARRDATHNDAFEHLVWLHSCSGSLGVMNARRLSHLKNAGASAALENARQDVLADVQQHISLSTLDMARCVSDFSDVNNVDMKVTGACGTRDPDDPYSREVTAAHMVNTMNFRVYKYLGL